MKNKRVRATLQERSKKTLEALLSAAEETIIQDGLQKATVSAICRRAGCTSGAFYARFEDKDALLDALQERYVQQVVESVAKRAASVTEVESLAEGIALYVRGVIDQHERRGQLMRAFVLRMRQDVAFRKRSRELNEASTQAFVTLLERFPQEVRKGDHARLAGICILLLHGALERAYLLADQRSKTLPKPGPELEDELNDVLLRYVARR